VAKKSSTTGASSIHAELKRISQDVSAMASSNAESAAKPLDVALSSNDVLDRLVEKIKRAGAQPEVFYIPLSTSSVWVVFKFTQTIELLTFRVKVDLATKEVTLTEDPFVMSMAVS